MSVSTPSHPRTLKRWLRPSRATTPFRTPRIPTATAAASACNHPALVHHYSPHTLLARLRLSCRYTLCQLAQWQSHVTLELHRPSLELHASQRRRCYAALLLDGETCSAWQAEVGGLLPVAHEPEYRELTTQFTLDWALPHECKAVEVDGPQHFLCEAPPTVTSESAWTSRPPTPPRFHPNGTTLLKRRLVQAAGWRLASVPFYEWKRLGSNRESKRAYCANLEYSGPMVVAAAPCSEAEQARQQSVGAEAGGGEPQRAASPAASPAPTALCDVSEDAIGDATEERQLEAATRIAAYQRRRAACKICELLRWERLKAARAAAARQRLHAAIQIAAYQRGRIARTICARLHWQRWEAQRVAAAAEDLAACKQAAAVAAAAATAAAEEATVAAKTAQEAAEAAAAVAPTSEGGGAVAEPSVAELAAEPSVADLAVAELAVAEPVVAEPAAVARRAAAGPSIRFQRVVPKAAQRQACPFFVRGYCMNGDKCARSHEAAIVAQGGVASVARERIVPRGSADGSALGRIHRNFSQAACPPQPSKPKICTFFAKGLCRYGLGCRFSHDGNYKS